MADEQRQRRSNGAVPEPEPAHTRSADGESEHDGDREATELRSVTSARHQTRRSRVLSPPARPESHWYDPVRKFWRHSVRITVPHDDCRDHLGKACKRFFVNLSYHTLSLPPLSPRSHFHSSPLTLVRSSQRAHIPWLPAYLPRPRHAGCHYRSDVPLAPCPVT